ncbi:hypothetical protein HY772_03960 [Candidatus Woesearchaeota archaeon]|nr:hypothetical protein [Candidatus Woesearchaeota archaeon]
MKRPTYNKTRDETRDKMRDKTRDKTRNRLLLLASLLLFMTFAASISVSASRFTDAMSRASESVSSQFTAEAPGMFDFILFAVMFFALCWIGFQRWFESARGAVIALSVTLAIALSAALVFGGRIGVKKLLPFASLLVFLLVIAGLAFILQRLVFRSETALSRIMSFAIAIILAALIMGLSLSSLCIQGSCDKNPLLSDLVGKTSAFGRITGWFDGLFGGPGAPTGPALGVSGRPQQKVIDEKLYDEATAWEKAQRTETDTRKMKDDLERANKAQEYIDRLTK